MLISTTIAMETLEHNLGYTFKNSALLAEALTHPSLAYEKKKNYSDNQRLEFLGDAVLQLTLTSLIYAQFPHYDEGDMTKLRSRMVSKEALFQFAKPIHLGSYMKLGKGEKASGGAERASTLADGLEAVIGAIYIDAGYETVFKVIRHLIGDALEKSSGNAEQLNPKGQLQEILQAIKPVSPSYHIIHETGPDHDKTFTVKILWDNDELSQGKGSSKKLAEANAAANALKSKKWATDELKS